MKTMELRVVVPLPLSFRNRSSERNTVIVSIVTVVPLPTVSETKNKDAEFAVIFTDSLLSPTILMDLSIDNFTLSVENRPS